MKSKIFEGSINGVKYNDSEEFNKALKNLKPEALVEVSSSFKVVETSDDRPVTEGKQILEDRVYNPFDVLGAIFPSIFNTLATANNCAIDEPKQDSVNVNDYIVKCNLDKLTGKSDDYKLLDEYSELLKTKQDAFIKLSDKQKKMVVEAIEESKNEADKKFDITANTIDRVQNEYEEKINEITSELENECERKTAILEHSINALQIQIDYYNELKENCK